MIKRSCHIVVVVEHAQGVIRPVTYELLAFAQKIKQVRQGDITAIILGNDIQDAAKRIAEKSGIRVLAVSDPQLNHYNGEIYKTVLKKILWPMNPSYVCVAHSSQGGDFAPGLAVRLNAACLSGVEDVTENDNKILFSRSLYGGKIHAKFFSSADTTLLMLQPGSYDPETITDAPDASGPEVVFLDVEIPKHRSRTLSVKSVQTDDLDLSRAKVIVSAGRGVGEQSNLDIVDHLAKLFFNSAVCASRPIVDLGWMAYNRQVGVTGSAVSPELYIACGISGTTQHVAGMKNSGFIVSINRDPNAAIFNVSDICIVEDLATFIPIFVETAISYTKCSP